MRGLIIGTGPSLRGQLELIPQFDGLVFGCNMTFLDIELDCWIACDPSFHSFYGPVAGYFDKWHWDKGICEKYGYKYVEGVWMVDGIAYPRDQYITPPGPCGGLWLKDKTRISLNHCSGAQLLNLACNQYEADEVILVGHDFKYEPGKPRHYFTGLSDVDGEYAPELRKTSEFRKPHDPDDLMSVYQRIAETPGLQTKIINCTPDSALPWFEMGRFEDYVSS
jgi:hypothetical protein